MSTIHLVLEPSADGTLHLPVPAEWRNRQIRVKAELEPLAGELKPKGPISPEPGCLKGFWMSADFDEPLEDFKEYME